MILFKGFLFCFFLVAWLWFGVGHFYLGFSFFFFGGGRFCLVASLGRGKIL